MPSSLSSLIPALPTGMNPLTLEFFSKELEGRFKVDYTNRSLPIVRVSMLVGALQYVLFYLLDLMIEPLLNPGSIWLLLLIRVSVFFAIMVILFWSFTDSFKKHFQFGISLVPLIAGFGVICMVFLIQNTSGYDQYHVGIMIIFFYIHVLLRLRFIYATAVGWAIFIMYLGAAYPVGSSDMYLANNTFFLISTQLCGMIASYALEYYARIVFRQRQDLEQRRRQIQLQHDLKEAELKSMRNIQLSLLPLKPPHHPDYKIAASMETATEVGGDFYDFAISRNGKLTFAIGDATGHGAKAGAIVTAAKVLFVSMAHRKDLVYILTKASSIIRTTGLKKLYMSMAIGRLYKNQLEIAGAGMPPAFAWRASTKTIEKLSLNGMPLGAAEYPYTVLKIPFYRDDILFLMSDGLPELFNKEGKMFGYDRPQKLLKKYTHMDPFELVSAIKSEILNFTGNESLRDDVSIIVIKKV